MEDNKKRSQDNAKKTERTEFADEMNVDMKNNKNNSNANNNK